MNDFKTTFARYVQSLEEALPGYLPQGDHRQKKVYDAMAYSLLGGGKRIRGVLTLAFYHLFSGGDIGPAVPFGAAVEMIHAYSLIHDDLPCMDDSTLRRGKPSCHVAYGEAVALLAGDGLLTQAFEIITRPQTMAPISNRRVLETLGVLARAAGAQGMIGGQIIDLENENRAASLEELRDMDGKKTGALFRACVHMGCILGGAEERATENALRYAGSLGLAFQILDDILDASGDAESLGKPAGSDAEHGKSTYVSLLGIHRARELAAQLGEDAKDAARAIGRDVEFLLQLVDTLYRREK